MQYTATCVDEGWNSVQYSLVMQLVQIRSNWVDKGGTQYNIICYATCADEVDSYTTHLLLQLGR